MKNNKKIKCLSSKVRSKGQYTKPQKPKNIVIYNNYYAPISY